MANLRFRVLGPLELWCGRRRLEIGAARQWAVLSLLLVHLNRPVSRDQMIDALWPGQPPASAVVTLHSLVHRLRKLLDSCGDAGEEVLHRGTDGYTLRVAPEAVDVYRFEQLAAEGRQAFDEAAFQLAVGHLSDALALWRGDAFAGVEVAAVRERATALDELRLDVSQWWLTAELELGNHDRVLADLDALTVEHPYREGLWALLMTALYRSGRRAAALEAYRRLQRLLGAELGLQPQPSTRQLHQKMLAGDPELEVASTQRNRPDQPVPRLLPVGIRGFTGRVKQVKALDGLLRAADQTAPSASIASISGPAGVGKTTLAVHWSHQVAEHFPDGQLYVNLRGFDPSRRAMDPAEVARFFLELLGADPRRIPAGLDARAARLRSLLAGKQMLILLDNAASEEQVRPLLPASPGCLVLVTSRHQLLGLIAAQAAHRIGLEPLSDTEAYELLARRLGHDRVFAQPEAAAEIVARCGGLPMALAVVAARADHRPDFPLDALAAQLRASKSSLDAFGGSDAVTDLRAVFSWSYEGLDPGSARLFRLLGLHPGPDFTPPAVASLAGLPMNQARALLGDLTRSQLVREHLPGRYTLHDLLRVYAGELAGLHESGPASALATQRLLDHYVHSARAAAVVLSPQRQPAAAPSAHPAVTPEQHTDQARALAWLDAERPTLLAMLDLAATTGADAHTLTLTWALADFLRRRGNWQELATAWDAALEAANRLGDLRERARSHRGVGRSAVDLGRLDDALHHFRQALELNSELDDLRGQADVHSSLCRVFDLQGNYDEALGHAQQAHRFYLAAGNRYGQAIALNNIGWYHAKRGDHRQAVSPCRQAKAIHEELGELGGVAAAWDSIGYALHHLNHSRLAIACHERAQHLYQGVGDRYSRAEALDRLGDAQQAIGELEAARRSWRQALDILEELDHPDADSVRAKLSSQR